MYMQPNDVTPRQLPHAVLSYLKDSSADHTFFNVYSHYTGLYICTVGIFRQEKSITFTHHGNFYKRLRYRGRANMRYIRKALHRLTDLNTVLG